MVRVFAVLAVLAFTLGFARAEAQEAKVIKVQGKKAIVLFPDSSRPYVGQTFDLSGGGGGSSSAATRNQIIGGSAEISSISRSTSSTSTTTFAVDGRYGWNKGDMEYGPLGAITYTSSPGTTSRTILGGGFFDYNLVPNTPGTELVYGGAATLSYATTATTTGSAERSASQIWLDVGGQVKWFPLGNTVAIRADLVYRYKSISEVTNYTDSGLVAKAGLYVYFW